MTSHVRLASAVILAAALGVSACSFELGSPPPRAEVAAVSACRARADEVFQRQNRDQVYRVDTYNTDTRDAPLGTNGLKGVTSARLSQPYGHHNHVQHYLRSNCAH